MNWKPYRLKYDRFRNLKTGRVSEGSIFKCSFCGGRGILPGTKGTKCHICRGSGEVTVDGSVAICAYCKGMGNCPGNTKLTCPVCRGKGLVSIDLPVEKCAICGGKGKVPGEVMPCRKCKGKGVVHKIDNSDKDDYYENY